MSEDSRNRIAAAEAAALTPDSLVGSFVHGFGDHIGHQGLIVGEPAPATFLVQWFSWLAGDAAHQELVGVERMRDWRFYDTAEAMQFAYEHGGVQRAWDRQRENDDAS